MHFKTLINQKSSFRYISIFIGFLLVPFCALRPTWHAVPFPPVPFNLDTTNLFVWSFLRDKGYIPFKDIWYPYGLQYYVNTDYPFGLLLAFLSNALVLYTFYYFATFYARQNLTKLALIITFSSVLLFTFDVGINFRYGMSVAILLWHIICSHRNSFAHQFLLLLVNIYSIFFEANQFLYGVLSFYIVHFVTHFRGGGSIPASLRIFSVDLFSIVISIFILISLLGEHIVHVYEFYLDLPRLAIYATIPITFKWLLYSVGSNFLVTFLILGASLAAIYAVFFRKDNAILYESYIGMWLLLLIIFPKELVRPDLSYQLNFIFVFAIALSISNIIQTKITAKVIVLLVVLSIFLCSTSIYRSYMNATQNFLTLVNYDKLVTEYQNSIDRFYDVKKFDERFNYALFEEKFNSNSIYVLGDNAHIYIGLKAKIPPYMSIYNTSTRFAQRQIIEWLKSNNIQYILVEKRLDFDYVPDVIRIPELYAYLVNNYRYDSDNKKYYIFKLQTHQDFSESWNIQLGKSIDYKYAIDSLKCESESPSLTIPDMPNKSTIKVEFNEDYVLMFNTQREGSICVNLSKLWFYNKNLFVKSVTINGKPANNFHILH